MEGIPAIPGMKREATFLSEPRDESRRKRWIPCQQARSGFYAGQRSRTVASEFLGDREAERRRSGLGNILKSPSCASMPISSRNVPPAHTGRIATRKLASGSFACEGRKREHARLSPFRSSLDRSAYGQIKPCSTESSFSAHPLKILPIAACA